MCAKLNPPVLPQSIKCKLLAPTHCRKVLLGVVHAHPESDPALASLSAETLRIYFQGHTVIGAKDSSGLGKFGVVFSSESILCPAEGVSHGLAREEGAISKGTSDRPEETRHQPRQGVQQRT